MSRSPPPRKKPPSLAKPPPPPGQTAAQAQMAGTAPSGPAPEWYSQAQQLGATPDMLPPSNTANLQKWLEQRQAQELAEDPSKAGRERNILYQAQMAPVEQKAQADTAHAAQLAKWQAQQRAKREKEVAASAKRGQSAQAAYQKHMKKAKRGLTPEEQRQRDWAEEKGDTWVDPRK